MSFIELNIEMMALIMRPNDLPRKFSRICEKPISIQNLMTSLGFHMEDLKMMQFFVSSSGSTEHQRVGKRHVLSESANLFITIPVGGG